MAETLHHVLHVKLMPVHSLISVVDNEQLPAGMGSAVLPLHGGRANLEHAGNIQDGRMCHYRINRLSADGKVQLNCEGSFTSDHTAVEDSQDHNADVHGVLAFHGDNDRASPGSTGADEPGSTDLIARELIL